MSGTPEVTSTTPSLVETHHTVVTKDLTIINKKGLHARATAKFVQCAERFEADITVTRSDETVGATSIMGILTLGAGIGTVITVSATGAQAQEAVEAIEALINDKFGEGE
jgi:phosphocarrier protein HPr